MSRLTETRRLQAVFLDRDGTLGGTGHFIHPRDFSLFPSTLDALNLLRDKGWKRIVVTNQHRIAQGEATVSDFAEEFAKFGLDAGYICPHEPSEDCDCHKPKPGLFLRAAVDHGLDLTRCAVIGDVGTTDMLAAQAIGAVKVLVRTGWGEASLSPYREQWSHVDPDYIADDVRDAARWLGRRFA